MSDTNDDQAAAMIKALAPKLAEAIMPQIVESVEEQIQGIKAKNDELLGTLKGMKDKQEAEQLSAIAQKQIRERLNNDQGISNDDTPKAITLSKEDARDVRKYRAARERAQKEGVELVVDRG
ncbi:hypothetical protein [Roseobacter sp. OBYS 0001]|uniref:hypothetical protein n=1 Tax=Roseobacter sp. OBYS 0001 TaxID=882651 RepID=UPI001BBB04AB|nr:hypothetical protein [Roseobacter sp. OBYS 0001]GIT86169.1 hypothetical protein ROBYS_11850 [Roseobacter sp. OBYS 0001]